MATKNWVTIGSINGLLRIGTEPLPDSMFTDHQRGFVALTWEFLHKICIKYLICEHIFEFVNVQKLLQLIVNAKPAWCYDPL